MKKLYVYPHAKRHVHDDMEIYYNTVPMSEKGIKENFQLSSPDEADYFYMGQIPNDKFNQFTPAAYKYLKGNESRHIVDVEGEGGMSIPPWIHDCVVTTMGPLKKYSNMKPWVGRMLGERRVVCVEGFLLVVPFISLSFAIFGNFVFFSYRHQPQSLQFEIIFGIFFVNKISDQVSDARTERIIKTTKFFNKDP